MNSLRRSEEVNRVAPPDDSIGSGGTPDEGTGSLLVPWQWPCVVSLQQTWSSASSGDVTRLATFEAMGAVVSLAVVLAGPAASPPTGSRVVRWPLGRLQLVV